METEKRFCPGKSAGAIIKNNRGEYLCLYRLKHPEGLAFIAGHIDAGETPEEALQREVSEETGLIVERFNLVFEGIVDNECSRNDESGKRYNAHEWRVYDVIKWDGAPELKEPTKHKFVKFMTLEQIRDYASREDIDPAWTEILNALHIL